MLREAPSVLKLNKKYVIYGIDQLV